MTSESGFSTAIKAALEAGAVAATQAGDEAQPVQIDRGKKRFTNNDPPNSLEPMQKTTFSMLPGAWRLAGEFNPDRSDRACLNWWKQESCVK